MRPCPTIITIPPGARKEACDEGAISDPLMEVEFKGTIFLDQVFIRLPWTDRGARCVSEIVETVLKTGELCAVIPLRECDGVTCTKIGACDCDWLLGAQHGSLWAQIYRVIIGEL